MVRNIENKFKMKNKKYRVCFFIRCEDGMRGGS